MGESRDPDAGSAPPRHACDVAAAWRPRPGDVDVFAALAASFAGRRATGHRREAAVLREAAQRARQIRDHGVGAIPAARVFTATSPSWRGNGLRREGHDPLANGRQRRRVLLSRPDVVRATAGVARVRGKSQRQRERRTVGRIHQRRGLRTPGDSGAGTRTGTGMTRSRFTASAVIADRAESDRDHREASEPVPALLRSARV